MKILIPVSVGELFDKISILEIKLNNIKDPTKLQNILNELSELRGVYFPNDDNLYDQLKEVNLKLWDIEDHIRIKERDKIFDNEFIELARSVYYMNDKRSLLKRIINLKYDSNIIEEKSYEKYE